MELSIQEIRGQLDTIDDQLTALFARRMELAKDVAAYKKANGLPILDTGRERQIINRVSAQAGQDLEHDVKLLYQTLFSVSRAYQARQLRPASSLTQALEKAAENVRDRLPNRALVACQGTEGAYSQKICDQMFEFADILYVNTFNDVFQAVETGMCPYGVLPIENSTAGSVTQVYDLMEKHRFYICGAQKLRIEPAKPVPPDSILGRDSRMGFRKISITAVTTLPKAPPMMTPTAMSRTLPLAMKVLNSSKNFFMGILLFSYIANRVAADQRLGIRTVLPPM